MLPEASSFGRRAEDVELMAARWKANIEACLTIYPTILKMAPEIFSAEKVDLKGADDLLSAGDGLAGSSPGKVIVPTAAAGNASLGTTKTTTTAAYINDPVDDDGRLDEELRFMKRKRIVKRLAGGPTTNTPRQCGLRFCTRILHRRAWCISLWTSACGWRRSEGTRLPILRR